MVQSLSIPLLVLAAFVSSGLGCFPADDPRGQVVIPEDVNDATYPDDGSYPDNGGNDDDDLPDEQGRNRWAVVDEAKVPAPPESPEKVDISQLDIVLDVVGEGVTAYEYDPAGYNSAAGGPVDSPQNLTCDFDRGACCWQNADVPLDHLQWQLATGIPEWGKMRSNFGPFNRNQYPLEKQPPMPNGRYLVVAAKDGSPADEAQFLSCSIPCSLDKVRVTARHWSTDNVLLQVCLRSSFFKDIKAAPLLSCRTLPKGKSPGLTTVVLDKADLSDIVFVASNLVARRGDAAIIDDIVVEYVPCPPPEARRTFLANENRAEVLKQTETQRPAAIKNEEAPKPVVSQADIDACKAVACDFEGNTCSYDLKKSMGFTKSFELREGRSWNRITGVPSAANGEGYLAAYLLTRETVGVYVNTEIESDLDITFMHYVSATGINLKVCCNGGDDCQYESTGVITGDNHRHWDSGALQCPAGTSKVYFICENTDENQGACAIDQIQLHSPAQFDLC